MTEIIYAIMCGEYMSDRTYTDRSHAEKVAKQMSAMTGRKWTVRKLERRNAE